jgi:hypothetical protein
MEEAHHLKQLREGSVESFLARARRSTRRLRSVQGLRDLHPPCITKTDGCDWLESLLIMDSSYPLRGR